MWDGRFGPIHVGYEVERMEYSLGQDGVMYLAKKTYEKIMSNKKINVTGMHVNNSSFKPTLIIEYGCGKCESKGVYELYDIGPRPPKPKKEVKLKKEQKPKNNKN